MTRSLHLTRWLKVTALTLMLAVQFVAHAQVRNITGIVKSDDGSPLPGASIVEKGTSNGTVTDAEGVYKLTVSGSDAVIVVSFIGMTPKEVTVGSQTSIDVQMEADLTTLNPGMQCEILQTDDELVVCTQQTPCKT